jgi:SEC-C motif-containing protein
MPKHKPTSPEISACPCGTGRPYATCCEPLHNGQPAPSAEALMRSRYSAFALDLPEYIQRSWHVSTRPAPVADAAPTRWLGLRIEHTETLADDRATVEFSARYKVGGRAFVLRETSRFVREGGHWFYVDGDVHSG